MLCNFKPEEIFLLNLKLGDEMRQREEEVKKMLITAADLQDGNLYLLNPEQIVDVTTGEMVINKNILN